MYLSYMRILFDVLVHEKFHSATMRVITYSYPEHFRPEGHREPRNEVGSLGPAERLVEIEQGTFRFLLQRLNPLGHSPHFVSVCL